MDIVISSPNESFEQRLRSYIRELRNPIVLDFTLGNESERVLTLSDLNKYTLSYSRPIFFNPFRIQVFDYEYIFSVEQKSNDGIFIQGSIRLKKVTIGFLLLLALLVGYNAYDYMFPKDGSFWFFHLGMPLIVLTYLLIELFLFRKKVKNFLNNIAK